MFDNGPSTTLTVFSDPQTEGRTIAAGDAEVVYSPDSPADSVYYIQRGQVRIYTVGKDGSSRLLEILGAGQWFGTAAMAGLPTHQLRAVVVGGATLQEVAADKLIAAMLRNPAQLLEMNRQLANRLLTVAKESSRLVFEDCNQRLISALIRFSTSAASTPREDGVVLRITHEQLAQAVGVARETVSLALTQLRHRNLLRTGRNQLMFNPESLRQFASSGNGSNGAKVAVERTPEQMMA